MEKITYKIVFKKVNEEAGCAMTDTFDISKELQQEFFNKLSECAPSVNGSEYREKHHDPFSTRVKKSFGIL